MKACKKCGVSKPLEDFYRALERGTGHRGGCKACTWTTIILPARSEAFCAFAATTLWLISKDLDLLKKAVAYLTSHDPEVQEEVQLARGRALSLVG